MNALGASRRRAALPIALLAGCAAVVLAACSSGAAGDPVAASPSGTGAPSGQSGSGFAQGQGNGFGPGVAASGEIAQISGRTLQVQNTTEQTAVTYSAKTTFTITLASSLSAVRVGSCVLATAASSGTTNSGATPAGTAPTSITATSVRISSAVKGSCGYGAFGGASGFPHPGASGFPHAGTSGYSHAGTSGFPRAGASGYPGRPSGVPSDLPSGFRGRGSFASIVSGKVTAVSGSTLSLAVTGRPGSASSTATTSTVTVTSTTKYTSVTTTTSGSAKVGRCAVVQGPTDTSGAVAASSIALSSPVNGSCTTFGLGHD